MVMLRPASERFGLCSTSRRPALCPDPAHQVPIRDAGPAKVRAQPPGRREIETPSRHGYRAIGHEYSQRIEGRDIAHIW